MKTQDNTNTHTVLVFKRFERLWHWSQALSIFALIFTGLVIHGIFRPIPFGLAVTIHTLVALALLVLWAFATFWLFTTGEWRQYIPTFKNMFKVAWYYGFGIFRGESHPYRKTYFRKHNPLQALTYLMVKIVIFPAIWISGLLYLVISIDLIPLPPSISIGLVALVHSIAAIAIMVFVIAHVYLLTTGHSFREHVRPMITGYDNVELTDEQLAYLRTSEPMKLREET